MRPNCLFKFFCAKTIWWTSSKYIEIIFLTSVYKFRHLTSFLSLLGSFFFNVFFFSLSALYMWDAVPNRAWLFHSRAAPDISYIVFNIVEIFVYKVQCHLIFLWSAPSLFSFPLAPSARSNLGALLFEYAEDSSLAGVCSVCLIRVWRDESKQKGFLARRLKRNEIQFSVGNKQGGVWLI